MSLPNLISLARLISVPLPIWFILDGHFTAAFWMFVAAGLSDGVDGFIAKRFDQRSELGALLDPIADKALIVSIFVTLGLADHLPSWLVILVVFRDLLIIGGFLLAAAVTQPMRWEPLVISKINTALQLILLAGVLAQLGLGLDDHGTIQALIYVVGVTTIVSGAGYLVRWARGLAGVELEP